MGLNEYDIFCSKADDFIEGFKKFYEEYKNERSFERLYKTQTYSDYFNSLRKQEKH